MRVGVVCWRVGVKTFFFFFFFLRGGKGKGRRNRCIPQLHSSTICSASSFSRRGGCFICRQKLKDIYLSCW